MNGETAVCAWVEALSHDGLLSVALRILVTTKIKPIVRGTVSHSSPAVLPKQ